MSGADNAAYHDSVTQQGGHSNSHFHISMKKMNNYTWDGDVWGLGCGRVSHDLIVEPGRMDGSVEMLVRAGTGLCGWKMSVGAVYSRPAFWC